MSALSLLSCTDGAPNYHAPSAFVRLIPDVNPLPEGVSTAYLLAEVQLATPVDAKKPALFVTSPAATLSALPGAIQCRPDAVGRDAGILSYATAGAAILPWADFRDRGAGLYETAFLATAKLEDGLLVAAALYETSDGCTPTLFLGSTLARVSRAAKVTDAGPEPPRPSESDGATADTGPADPPDVLPDARPTSVDSGGLQIP
jgi:hypothetical protein